MSAERSTGWEWEHSPAILCGDYFLWYVWTRLICWANANHGTDRSPRTQIPAFRRTDRERAQGRAISLPCPAHEPNWRCDRGSPGREAGPATEGRCRGRCAFRSCGWYYELAGSECYVSGMVRQSRRGRRTKRRRATSIESDQMMLCERTCQRAKTSGCTKLSDLRISAQDLLLGFGQFCSRRSKYPPSELCGP